MFGVEVTPSVIPEKYKARARYEAIASGAPSGIWHSENGAWCIRPVHYRFHTVGRVWLLAGVVYPVLPESACV